MTMHLAVGLTTTGKKKGKVKWASAEQKRQHEQLDREWTALKKKHGSIADDSKKTRALKAVPYVAPKVLRRESDQPRIASLNSSWDPCLRAPDKIYTGTAMIGIGVLHKSNAVPIFNHDAVIDISKMRR